MNWEKYETPQIFSIFQSTCNSYISRKKDIQINLIKLKIWSVIYIQVNQFVCTNPFSWPLWPNHFVNFHKSLEQWMDLVHTSGIENMNHGFLIL